MKRRFSRIVSVVCAMAFLVTSIVFFPTQKNSADEQYELVWSDEFDGNALDDNNWTCEIGTGAGGWGNNEQQYYRDSADNIEVSNGTLKIHALKQSYGGKQYTSARLKTQGKQSFKYGKIEAKMRLPRFQGAYPGFWTLGENITSVGWPACGEMDIMEAINDNDNIYSNLHWVYNGSRVDTSGGAYNVGDRTQWHTYGMIWSETKASFYVDDNVFQTYNITSESQMEEFRRNQFIILNLAIGGNWPGNEIDNDAFPDGSTMEVDYVRVFQKPEEQTTTDTSTETTGVEDEWNDVPNADPTYTNGPWNMFANYIDDPEITGNNGKLQYKKTGDNPTYSDYTFRATSVSGWEAWSVFARLENYLADYYDYGDSYDITLTINSSQATVPKTDPNALDKLIVLIGNNKHYVDLQEGVNTLHMSGEYAVNPSEPHEQILLEMDGLEPGTELQVQNIAITGPNDGWTNVPNKKDTKVGDWTLFAWWDETHWSKLAYRANTGGNGLGAYDIKVRRQTDSYGSNAALASLPGYLTTAKDTKDRLLANADEYEPKVTIDASGLGDSVREYGSVRALINNQSFEFDIRKGKRTYDLYELCDKKMAYDNTKTNDIVFELDQVKAKAILNISSIEFVGPNDDSQEVPNGEAFKPEGTPWILYAITSPDQEKYGAMKYEVIGDPANISSTKITLKSVSGWFGAQSVVATLNNYLNGLEVGHDYKITVRMNLDESGVAPADQNPIYAKAIKMTVDGVDTIYDVPNPATTTQTYEKSFRYTGTSKHVTFNFDQLLKGTKVNFASVEITDPSAPTTTPEVTTTEESTTEVPSIEPTTEEPEWVEVPNNNATKVGVWTLYARFDANSGSWGKMYYSNNTDTPTSVGDTTIYIYCNSGWLGANSILAGLKGYLDGLEIGKTYKITAKVNFDESNLRVEYLNPENAKKLRMTVDEKDYDFDVVNPASGIITFETEFTYTGTSPDVRFNFDQLLMGTKLRFTDVEISDSIATTTPSAETTTVPEETTTPDIEGLREQINQLSLSLSQHIENYNTKISSLEAQLAQLRGELEDGDEELSDRIDGLNTQLTNIRNQIVDINSAMEDLENDVANNSSSINELQSDMESVLEDLASIDDRIEDAKAEVEGAVKEYVDGQVETINGEIDTINDSINGLRTLIGTLPDGSSVQSEIEDLQSSVTEIQEQIGSVDLDQIARNKQQLATLENRMLEITNAIAQNLLTETQNRINDTTRLTNTINGINETLTAKDTDLQNQVNTLNVQLQSANEDIESINNTIVGIQSDISANVTNISKNASDIQALVEQLSLAKAELDTVDDRIQTAKDDTLSLAKAYTDQKMAEMNEDYTDKFNKQNDEIDRLNKEILGLKMSSSITKLGLSYASRLLVNLRWNKHPYADGYEVYVMKPGQSQYEFVSDTKSMAFAYSIAMNASYKFMVKAYMNDEKSGSKVYAVESNAATAIVTAPAKVVLKKVKAGKKKCTVQWNAVPKAVGYQIYYKQKKAKTITVKANQLSQVIKKLKKKKKVTVKVRAFTKYGVNTLYGAWSNVKNVKIK